MSVTQRTRFPAWPRWAMLAGAVLFVLGAAGAVLIVGPAWFGPGTIARLSSAPVSFLVLSLVATLGFFIFTVGMCGYVIVGSLSHDLAEHSYNSIGTILACFGTAVVAANVVTGAIALSGSVVLASPAGVLTPGALTLSVLTLDGALLGVLFLRIVRPGVMSWKQMGLVSSQFSERVLQGIGYGIVTIIGSGLIGLALQQVGVQQTQEAMFGGVLNAPPGQFLGVLLAVGGFAPIVEETFFRGYVFIGLGERWGTRAAFAVSALLFAVAHTNLQAFLLLFYAGLVLTYARWRSGSLVPGMIAHSLNNTLAFLTLYLAPHH